MQRFFFHVVSGTSRYADDTGTMLPSLADVLQHGTSVANALTKHHVIRSNVAKCDDYLEVEDQESKFLITLPFARLLTGMSPSQSGAIDLNEHRLARQYARALPV